MNTPEDIDRVIAEIAHAVGGKVEARYSGRGMFGDTCVGIVCRDPLRTIEEAAARGLRGAHQDQMGLDHIVYWPHLRRP